jgi:hypothetical protein
MMRRHASWRIWELMRISLQKAAHPAPAGPDLSGQTSKAGIAGKPIDIEGRLVA